ncbi:MAG: transcription-repair coupling factor [Clostridia bacterium]|jgi:transcription-repair coupling factor (superfamily II helicase)
MSDILFTPLEQFREYRRLLHSIRGGQSPASVFGLSETQKSHMIAALSKHIQRPVLIVTYNDVQARKIYEDLSFYGVGEAVLFPAREISFYRIAARSMDIPIQRLEVLKQIYQGSARFVVASVEALLARLAPPELFLKGIRNIAVGDVMELQEMARWLTANGYERVEMVEGKGQYSIRGGILDIYPLTAENGYRLEFFDDEVDSIREFDVTTQRSIQKLEKVEVFPAMEIVLGQEEIRRGIKLLEEQLALYRKGDKLDRDSVKLISRIEEDIRTLKEGGYPEPTEAYIPIFYEEDVNLLDYLGENTLVFLDEPPRIRERTVNTGLEFEENFKILLERGEVMPVQAHLFTPYDAFLRECLGRMTVTFHMLPRAAADIKPKGVYHFTTRTMHSFHGQLELLAEDLLNWRARDYRTLILSGTRSRGQRLVQILEDFGVQAVFTTDRHREMQPGEITILPGSISKGFEYPDIRFALISDQEIFGVQKKRTRVRGKKSGQKIDVFTDLKVGDYVVHERHGIGVYVGIEKLVVEGKSRDYLHIRYAAGDKLYVPTDQMDMIQRYIGIEGKEPRLSKLGGTEWARTKKRVKESIKEMAEDLIQLYAARQSIQGHTFQKDTPWQRQFEDNFPYEETPDQLQCIEEVKKDMESSKVMDRLLCGDVGYGKTEVAIRAAFKAVVEGKQVAFLVPTTILAQQHYNTLMQRFAEFPVTIEVLSRFRSPAEQKDIVRRIFNGSVDIVVGTHRLLGKDVRFKDLGLLIIDEEQRFGVAHKETIKTLRKNVDVLTLTATPIPRTLHMSLVGIRDMSIIENPPEERYPVQTYVVEYNEGLVRDAILREIQRGGQVYFVYNRVRSIDRITSALRELVPEARITAAHGQMSENLLEEVMMDFYNKEFDVLVCTTIIETGLDIPNVNTIIIYDADRFGLAQLYQLRGRVGRSNRLAYAYLTFRKDKVLTEVAEKRLHAIKEFTEFGSGFKIAMRDLEIRGAGNILGAEQHGHMSAVGYDLYCKLLEETLRKMKGELFEEEELETGIDIRMDAYIPEDYIRDEGQKIEIYKKIASIRSKEDYNDVEEEIEDRFGDFPPSVQNLMAVAYLKVLASRLRIASVVHRPGQLVLKFHDGKKIEPRILLQLVNEYRSKVSLSATQPPFLTWKDKHAGPEKLVKDVQAFLEKIIHLQNH